MTDAHGRYDRAVSTLSRRRVLAGGATLLTAGGTLVWVGDDARAAVSIDSFAAKDRSFAAEQVAPVVAATVKWDYDVGTAVVSGVRLTLSIDGTTVATTELRTDRTTLSNDTTLSGSVTDSEAWTIDDFTPAVGSSVSRTVTVAVEFAVLDDAGDVLVSDTASDNATVSVSHPQASEYIAQVGGTATFETPSQ